MDQLYTQIESLSSQNEALSQSCLIEHEKYKGINKDLSLLSNQYNVLSSDRDNIKAEFDKTLLYYKRESELRRYYKNIIEDNKGNIRVYARIRPLSIDEIGRNDIHVIKSDLTTIKINSKSRGEKSFEFDAIFDENSTQGNF